MPVRIAVIAEADADRRIVCDLIDRKIQAHAPDWLDDAQLAVEREYCGLAPGTPFTRWRELRDLPSPKGALRSGGYIGFGTGQHLRFDYPLGRKALVSSALAVPRIDIVILVRDMDQQPADRAASLAQAREEIPLNRLTVVLALPRAKREAWSMNGFDPENEAEMEALEEMRAELGFDPRIYPERLDAMEHGAKRDAKRVLGKLVNDDHDREAKCWQETAWNTLRERGTGSGLAAFLTEVKERLVPLVTGQPV